MLEEPKVSVSQGYKDPWRFKLMVVKHESVWGYCTVSVWRSCCSTVSQEKVKIFWKWCLHRWQIPLSVQIRLSKTKQPLSQRKKTDFPRIEPFLLPPFPQLLVHCQLTSPSALTPSSSQKRSYLLLAVDSQPQLPCSCSEHYIPLLPALIPLNFVVPCPVCNIMCCLSKRCYLSLKNLTHSHLWTQKVNCLRGLFISTASS